MTEAGIRAVAQLKRLKELRIGKTSLTDAGLRILFPLKNLKSISLEMTQVTEKGIADLRAAIPGITIKK
ncbi:MAG: hypothetical protein EXS05_12430 [Planctomycetaceae bacterium]|nr:hypothetical protein [Planctomycetaceae bacterium]